MTREKQYLGDGAYVSFDGFGLTLTAENGISTTNTIYLEPEVYESLVKYVEQIRQKAKQREDDREPSDREIQATYDSAFEQQCKDRDR